MEDEVFELVEVHSAISMVVHFLQKLSRVPFLDGDLKLNEHFLQLIQTQKVVFVDIKLVEELFQHKLFMSAFCFLNQLESDQFDSVFDFFRLYFLERHIRYSPLRTNKPNKSFIVRNVKTQVIIKVEELFLSNVSIRCQWY